MHFGQRALDVVLDIVQVKQRTRPLVVRQPRHHVRRELPGEMTHRLIRLVRIDVDASGILMREIPQHAHAEIKVLIEQRPRRRLARLFLDIVPVFA